MKGDLTPPARDHGTRSVCGKCGGLGILTELRVVWKKPRVSERGEAMPPLKCSRRVADEEECARESIALRAAGMIEVDCVSSAGLCTCRAKKQEPAAPAEQPDQPRGETAREQARRLRVADKD